MTEGNLKKNRWVYAAFTILLMALVVIGYAAVGPGIANAKQATSLIVGAVFLSALFILRSEQSTQLRALLQVLCAVAATAVWAYVWAFANEKSIMVGIFAVVIALTSRHWLRWM